MMSPDRTRRRSIWAANEDSDDEDLYLCSCPYGYMPSPPPTLASMEGWEESMTRGRVIRLTKERRRQCERERAQAALTPDRRSHELALMDEHARQPLDSDFRRIWKVMIVERRGRFERREGVGRCLKVGVWRFRDCFARVADIARLTCTDGS